MNYGLKVIEFQSFNSFSVFKITTKIGPKRFVPGRGLARATDGRGPSHVSVHGGAEAHGQFDHGRDAATGATRR